VGLPGRSPKAWSCLSSITRLPEDCRRKLPREMECAALRTPYSLNLEPPATRAQYDYQHNQTLPAMPLPAAAPYRQGVQCARCPDRASGQRHLTRGQTV
jgi:hypothetical protein